MLSTLVPIQLSANDNSPWRLFGLMGFPQICHEMTEVCNFGQVQHTIPSIILQTAF